MSKIIYINGDATEPIGEGKKLLVHICNDVGAWGAGFVLAISSKWPEPEQSYRKWFYNQNKFELGYIQKVPVGNDITVVNMIAQHGVGFNEGGPPLRYVALRKCLEKVAIEALDKKASVHMPRIGCGLAGGSWDAVGDIIDSTLIKKQIVVIVYDYDGN